MALAKRDLCRQSAKVATVKNWLDIVDALYEGSWSQDLRRFRSPFAFRGLSRVNHTLVELARAPRRRPGGRRTGRARAAAQLPEVRARRSARHRFDLGLARARAASRPSHAVARLDLLAARGAALRHRRSRHLQRGRRRVVRELRRSQQAAAAPPEEDPPAGRLRHLHRRDAQRLGPPPRMRTGRSWRTGHAPLDTPRETAAGGGSGCGSGISSLTIRCVAERQHLARDEGSTSDGDTG